MIGCQESVKIQASLYLARYRGIRQMLLLAEHFPHYSRKSKK